MDHTEGDRCQDEQVPRIGWQYEKGGEGKVEKQLPARMKRTWFPVVN